MKVKVQIGIFKCTVIMGQDLIHPYIQSTTVLCDKGEILLHKIPMIDLNLAQVLTLGRYNHQILNPITTMFTTELHICQCYPHKIVRFVIVYT